MARTKVEIATHIIYRCEGDNCECCDWPDEDRAALEGMSFEEADRLTCEVTPITPAPCDDADCYCHEGDDDGEDDRTVFDLSDDAEALASAGMGTDEDYFFGDTE